MKFQPALCRLDGKVKYIYNEYILNEWRVIYENF